MNKNAFEHYMKSTGNGHFLDKRQDGTYVHPITGKKWETWKASQIAFLVDILEIVKIESNKWFVFDFVDVSSGIDIKKVIMAMVSDITEKIQE